MAVGCTRTVSLDEFSNLVREPTTGDIDSWWYDGSDAEYHYFTRVRPLSECTFRVCRGRLGLKREFPHTLNRERWIRLPFGLVLPDAARLDYDLFVDWPAAVPAGNP
jgi:hypothetical protein